MKFNLSIVVLLTGFAFQARALVIQDLQCQSSAYVSSYDKGLQAGKQVAQANLQKGLADGAAQGSAAGAAAAATLTGQRGTANGQKAGYQDGYKSTYQDSYKAAYKAAYNPAYQLGYKAGVNDRSSYNNGYNDGVKTGSADGWNAGENQGYNDGYAYSYSIGYDSGYSDGYSTGYNNGFSSGQSTCRSPRAAPMTDGVSQMIGGLISLPSAATASATCPTIGNLNGYSHNPTVGSAAEASAFCTQLACSTVTDTYQVNYRSAYKAAYDKAFAAGKAANSSYQSAYSNAYSSAFAAGAAAGTAQGIAEGTDAGNKAGYKAGYLAGQSVAYQNGYNAGYAPAYNDAYSRGYSDGYSRGQSRGWSDGRNTGYNDGYYDGYRRGYSDGQSACSFGLQTSLVSENAPPLSAADQESEQEATNAEPNVSVAKPVKDPTDPQNVTEKFVSYPLRLTSSQYKDNMKNFVVGTLRAPSNAAYIYVSFSSVDLEADYDSVSIVDAKGKVCAQYSGTLGKTYSAICLGDTAQVLVSSDDSVSGSSEYAGLEIDGYIYGVTTQDSPPVAVVSGSLTATVGQPIRFAAGQSLATAPHAKIVSYDWDFFDGSNGNAKVDKHAFNAPGSYWVSLTAWDSKSQYNTAYVNVVVNGVSAPVKAKVVKATNKSVKLDWVRGGNDEATFVLASAAGSMPSCSSGKNIGAGTSYVVNGLNPNTTYNIVICAVNKYKVQSSALVLTATTLTP